MRQTNGRAASVINKFRLLICEVIIRHVSHFRKHGEVICACDMYLNIHDSGSDGTDEYPVDHDS